MLVLKALRKAELYCSQKKSSLFTTDINFLGHHISVRGIKADNTKVKRILNGPTPKSAKHIHQFLGLVRYISMFLPSLAEHTSILMLLMQKECNATFPLWTSTHRYAFESIKRAVVSWDCLTTIDHKNPGENKIFVTCDASKCRTGAVLVFGPTWESVRPVAFKSRQLNGVEQNYSVHEQGMFVIVQALKKWRVNLLGTHIHICTNHKTLQNFNFQRNLSQC